MRRAVCSPRHALDGQTTAAHGDRSPSRRFIQWLRQLEVIFTRRTDLARRLAAPSVRTLVCSVGICLALVPAIADADDLKALPLVANDLIWDPGTQMIYASVPGSAGPGLGNTITAINPYTGAVGPSIFVGSEPGKLARSDDGRFLYVALDGAASIRRVNLQTGRAELQFALGNDPFFGPRYAEDIAVQPGNPQTVAVSLKYKSVSPKHAGVAIYDDGVPRATLTPGHTGSNVIEFSRSGSLLYGYCNETTDFGFRRMAVAASGVSVLDVTRGLISAFGLDIAFDGDRVYSSIGGVIDPAARTIVGTYPGLGFGTIVRPDSTVGRTFALAQGTIVAFDQATFVTMGTLRVPGVSSYPDPGSLIRWGADGLAFRWNGKVFLVRTSLVPSTTTPAPTPTPTLTLALGGGSAFHAGDTMTATLTFSPGQISSAIDAYAVIQTPDGGFLSLQASGQIVAGLSPFVARIAPAPASWTPLRYQFTGKEPAGAYKWLTALTEAGTLNVIGAVNQQVFTVSP
jgi:DNA-binding beta-propeller fold protein YncE